MTRIRYTMPARSQGELHMRRGVAKLVEKDVHRWVFVCSMDSDVEALVRKWLVQWLDDFYCGLQVMCIPRFTSPTRVGTHVEVDTLDAVKAIVKATGLSPYLFVRGWPLCLNDVDSMEGGAM